MKLDIPVSIVLVTQFLIGSALAQSVIQGVTSTATSEWTADWVGAAVNLTNNSGLSSPYDVTATHAPSTDAAGQWHNNVGFDPNPIVNFDLGGSFDLEAIYIWNGNQTFATNRGVQQFDVWVSTDDGATWLLALDDATLTQSPGDTSVSAQYFDLTGFNGVTQVEIEPVSNYGDAYTGLSEVMFTRVSGPPFEEYITTTWGLSGDDADPDFDYDGDGLANAIEFVLGSDPTTESAAFSPITTIDPAYLVFSFRRNAKAAADSPVVEYGSTLSGWVPAQAEVDGVIVEEEADFFGAGIDRVTVRIPRSLESGSKLFARLAVDVAISP